MSQNSQPCLPGPVQQPGAQLPTATVNISLQPLASSPTNTTGSTASIPSIQKRNAAWKYEGYQGFWQWMASDDDFFVFRRFESLNAGVILWMQDRIVQLETKLDAIHRDVASSSDPAFHNGSFRTDAINQPRREQIMRELSSVLHHYNEYIEAFSKVRSRPRAGKHLITNVQNWLKRNAIDRDEANFINHTSDLVGINFRTRLPIGRLLEACSSFRFSRFFRTPPVPGAPVSSGATTYSSDQRFDRTTNAIIIIVGLAMLLAPMWWLEFVSNSKKRLGIITGFVCVFIFMMTTATINKPFEVVAATAAYAAVLMVFMQIQS